MYGRSSCAECFLPALAGPAFWRNDQTIVLDAQLDHVTQPALLDEGLRNANTPGIADTNLTLDMDVAVPGRLEALTLFLILDPPEQLVAAHSQEGVPGPHTAV